MTDELSLLPNSDMATFSPEIIKRAGDLLGIRLDEATVIKALIIQNDTGLSIARGEISIIPFNGKNTVFVNKQGYLAYASRHEQYDGYEWGIEGEGEHLRAWCKVYRKDRTRPVYEDAWISEDKKNTPIWTQMPKRMLAKVAIKRAHQAAFPILNGLLCPEEIDEQPAYKIQKREDDIIVQPEPAPTPQPAQPVQPTSSPSRLYTAQQAEDALQNYVSRGWELDIFEKAKIDAKSWNGDMIDADFKQRLAAQKTAAAPAALHTASTSSVPSNTPVQTPLCPKCGKPSMTAEEAGHIHHLVDGKPFDKTLCKDCIREWYKTEKLGKEQPQANPEDITRPFCTKCGERRVTEPEETMSRNFFGERSKELQSQLPPKPAPAPEPEPKYKCSRCGSTMTPNEWAQALMFSDSDNPVCSKCMDAEVQP